MWGAAARRREPGRNEVSGDRHRLRRDLELSRGERAQAVLRRGGRAHGQGWRGGGGVCEPAAAGETGRERKPPLCQTALAYAQRKRVRGRIRVFRPRISARACPMSSFTVGPQMGFPAQVQMSSYVLQKRRRIPPPLASARCANEDAGCSHSHGAVCCGADEIFVSARARTRCARWSPGGARRRRGSA